MKNSAVLTALSFLFVAAASNVLFADVDFEGEEVLHDGVPVFEMYVDMDESHDICVIHQDGNTIRVDVLEFEEDDFPNTEAWLLLFAYRHYSFEELEDLASDHEDYEFDLDEDTDARRLTVRGFGGHDIIVIEDVQAVCEIYGGDGDDYIQGTQYDYDLALNRIFGEAGDDEIHGGPCRDRILGGIGHDELHGHGRDDEIFGDDGNDEIFGGAGRDHLLGEAGDDYIEGNDGDDELWGLLGDDHVRGGAGDDEVYGNLGDDTLEGNAGDDTLEGGLHDDTMYGNEGNDIMHGGDGHDDMQGNAGNDLIYGEAGSDTMSGGDGNDWIRGGLGPDELHGDAGDDDLYGDERDDDLFGGPGTDYLSGGTGRDVLDGGFDGCEDFLEGGGQNDEFLFRRYELVAVKVHSKLRDDPRQRQTDPSREFVRNDVRYEQLTVEMDRVLDYQPSGDTYTSEEVE